MSATDTAEVLRATSSASSRAAGSSASGATTRLTRPPAWASSAEKPRPEYVHAVIAVGAVEGLDQLPDHRRVDGVEAIGAMQGERRHALGDVVANGLEVLVHRLASDGGAPAPRRPAARTSTARNRARGRRGRRRRGRAPAAPAPSPRASSGWA